MWQALWLPIVPTAPFPVKVTSGNTLKCQGRFDNVSLQIQGIPFSLTLFFITDGIGCCVGCPVVREPRHRDLQLEETHDDVPMEQSEAAFAWSRRPSHSGHLAGRN